MASLSEPSVIVAAGCAADCQGLVQKFTTAAPADYSFRAFTEKWRSMSFELILSLRPPVEAAFLAQEILGIVKDFLVAEGVPVENKVGYMYLLYSLYYKQKYNKKIRLTLDQYCDLFKTVLLFKENGFKEAEFAFFKLFFDNAFHFCATSHEYTFLHKQKSCLEDEENKDFVPDVRSLLVECDALSKDSLSELDLLHSKYEELKRNFPSAVGTHYGESSLSDNFIGELQKEIEAVKRKYEQYKNARPSSRQSSIAILPDDDHGAQRRELRNRALQTETDDPLPPSSGGRSRGRPPKRKNAR